MDPNPAHLGQWTRGSSSGMAISPSPSPLPQSPTTTITTTTMDPPRNIYITFCRAEHLPIADISSLSSDPYVSATLQTPFSDRDKVHSPPLRFRSPTEQRTINPKWDWHWDVGNVPRFGTKLHVHVMDEDCRDHDDRLGHVTIDFADLGKWDGEDAVNENWYKLRKKGASKKAAVLRMCAAGVSAVGGSADGEGGSARVLVRIEVKGVTKLEKDRFLQRAFTIGPSMLPVLLLLVRLLPVRLFPVRLLQLSVDIPLLSNIPTPPWEILSDLPIKRILFHPR